MPFLEIAFQAEVSRYEDQEFEEYAKKNCNETFETRGKVIEELRRMIRERGECNPRRMDDAYLLRFLRSRKFVPALAHKLLLVVLVRLIFKMSSKRTFSQRDLGALLSALNAINIMVRYEDFRRKNAYLYNCDGFGLQKVKHVYGGVLPESPDNGRIILMRFGRWDTQAVPIDDVVRCALFMDEVAVMQPKIQILGVTIVVDLDGLSVRHVTNLTPTVAGQIVALMGVSFPLTMHGLHIINYNWVLHSVFYLFKRFMPSAVWQRLHFHGSDLSSLHKFIHPQYLPRDLGGHCRHFISTEEWITKIDAYKDDFIVKELKDLGFYVRG